MPARLQWNRPTLIQVRTFTGLVFGLFVTMHLSNHALGLISLHAQEVARPWFMGVWHTLPMQVLLYGSLLTHAGLGLYSLGRHRHYRMPAWEISQIVLGLFIPYVLFTHIINTRGTRILTHIDITYAYEVVNLWLDPKSRYLQIGLVIVAWSHLAVGLHFWLRNKAWYHQVFAFVLPLYFLLPAAAIAGFCQSGLSVAAQARQYPAWAAALRKAGVPHDPANARVRAFLKAWIAIIWLGVVALVFAASRLRHWLSRRRTYRVTYPESFCVKAPIGASILEASRMAGRPHMSVCGGRGRCTTCRVRIIRSDGDLPPIGPTEARALEHIGAPPGLRLACQTRPRVDVEVQPLMHPGLVLKPARGKRGFEFGQERHVTVLFIDLRNSTKLAEKRMPYDVVFLLNHVFEEMATAVENAGGHYSNFTGDGLMALFGLPPAPDTGARAAIVCAAEMMRRLEHLNERMAGELETPIQIGVGIHSGVAIVGRMGPPKTPIITALGDTVNTTARLEGQSKDLKAPLIVSAQTLAEAGLAAHVSTVDVQLRGRATSLAVAALDRQTAELLLSGQACSILEPVPEIELKAFATQR